MHKILLLLALALAMSALQADYPVAPSFTLADSEGVEVSLPRAGHGVDIFFFWASWCPYCKALMPHLQSIKHEYGDAVEVFALNIRDDEDPRAFMDELGYEFVVLPDADAVMSLYGVKSTPAVFVVDGKQRIRFNLYQMVFDDSEAFKSRNHSGKAALRAPAWSAEMRRRLDEILSEENH